MYICHFFQGPENIPEEGVEVLGTERYYSQEGRRWGWVGRRVRKRRGVGAEGVNCIQDQYRRTSMTVLQKIHLPDCGTCSRYVVYAEVHIQHLP